MDFLASWSSEEITDGGAGRLTAVPGRMACSAAATARPAVEPGCGGAGVVDGFCVLM